MLKERLYGKPVLAGVGKSVASSGVLPAIKIMHTCLSSIWMRICREVAR